jgi:hypothetical protein
MGYILANNCWLLFASCLNVSTTFINRPMMASNQGVMHNRAEPFPYRNDRFCGVSAVMIRRTVPKFCVFQALLIASRKEKVSYIFSWGKNCPRRAVA